MLAVGSQPQRSDQRRNLCYRIGTDIQNLCGWATVPDRKGQAHVYQGGEDTEKMDFFQNIIRWQFGVMEIKKELTGMKKLYTTHPYGAIVKFYDWQQTLCIPHPDASSPYIF